MRCRRRGIRPRASLILAAGILVLGPSTRPSAEVARWTGIVAAGLGALSGIFLVPYYPVWALIYVGIAIAVIYGLTAHFNEEHVTLHSHRTMSG